MSNDEILSLTFTNIKELSLPIFKITSCTITVKIDWGDGIIINTPLYYNNSISHIYTNNGTFNVIITIDNGTGDLKFGDFDWIGAESLTEVGKSISPLFRDLSFMFYNASSFNGDISGWNVSNVNNMAFMFANSSFNGDISGWNVSNVNNMAGMFYNAISFNGDISGWNVSNVTDMFYMFYNVISLKTFVCPLTMTKLYSGQFVNCLNLTTITLSDNLNTNNIPAGIFNNSPITNIYYCGQIDPTTLSDYFMQ